MNWQSVLYILPGIILGLTVHEFCHAFAAYKLGDSTAKDQGRLTLNPIKHIDIIGLLFIIIARFGWAKPVQFNPDNLRHPKRDKAIIAAAGPLANLLLALLLIYIIKGYELINARVFFAGNYELFGILNSEAAMIVLFIVLQAIWINLGLFIFNLLPLPPLDGSHIFLMFLNLPYETEVKIMKIVAPLLFIIIIIQQWTGITILPVGRAVGWIMSLFFPELMY